MKRTQILLPLSLGGLLSLGTVWIGGCSSDSTSTTTDAGSKADGTSSGSGSGSSSGGGSGSGSGGGSGSSSGGSTGSSSGGGSGSSSGGSSGANSDAGTDAGGTTAVCATNATVACPTCTAPQVCCATRCKAPMPQFSGQKFATTACTDPTACMGGGIDMGVIACGKPSDCPTGQTCCGPHTDSMSIATKCEMGTTCATGEAKVCVTNADCAGQLIAGTPATACGVGPSSAGVYMNCRASATPVDAGGTTEGGTPEAGGSEAGSEAAPPDSATTDAPTGG